MSERERGSGGRGKEREIVRRGEERNCIWLMKIAGIVFDVYMAASVDVDYMAAAGVGCI